MLDVEQCLKDGNCKLKIRGVTQDGDKFRPSAWTNMLVDSSREHDGVILSVCEGVQCIDLDINSKDAKRILQFATDNKLLIEGDKTLPLEDTKTLGVKHEKYGK